MRTALITGIFLVLAANTAAQTAPDDNDKKLAISIKTGLTSSSSEIDRELLPQGRVTLEFKAGINGEGSRMDFRGYLADGGIGTSIAGSVDVRTGLRQIRKINIGIGLEYLGAKEYDPLAREINLTADTRTSKHYGLFGPDVVYGEMNGVYIRGAYLFGASYIRTDGVFFFNDDKEATVKLADHDTLPLQMARLEGALPEIWRLRIGGSVRYVRTVEVSEIRNTKKFIPPSHTVTDVFADIRTSKFLTITASGTFTDNERGMVFLGNSLKAGLTLVF